MGLRSFLNSYPERNTLSGEVDPRFELPALVTRDESQPVVFESIAGYPDVRGVSNVVSSREMIGEALGVDPGGIIDEVSAAMDDPTPLERERPPAFETVAEDPVIDEHLPIPVYYEEYEREYFASTIVVTKDPETGVHNLSFHRMMYDGGNTLVMRMVERHLHDIYTRTEGGLDVAILMGVHPAVEIAAATSFSPDMSELELANRLHGDELATTDFHGLTVPSDAEVAMFATITDETAEEGPFVDLSRTWDRTRQQPVIDVHELHARPDPLSRIIVPGKREHAHLMGIPQEPRIYRIVENTVPTVQNVVLTPGGCSWLHGVVQIEKRTEGDPKNAGMAALAAHPSMKKVTVVDEDIDPADPDAVEWATATRMQPHRDIVTIERAKGSSLDPSQNYDEGLLTKWIVDATKPFDKDAADFAEATIPGEDDLTLEEYK
jgi:2,5-furandicarboxylate decarboxylase 1